MRFGLALSLAIHGLAAAALVIWGVARAAPDAPMRRISVAIEADDAPAPEPAIADPEELPTMAPPEEAWPLPEEEPPPADIQAPPRSVGVGGDRMPPVVKLRTPLRLPARAPAPELKRVAAPPVATMPVAAAARPAVVREPRLLPDSAPARYPDRARRRGLEGTVVLRLRVAADGTVERVEVATSSGHEILDRAAEEAAPKWRYEPALRDGVAIAYDVRQPVEFTLGDT